MTKNQYYTTQEVANLLPNYSGYQTLLKALHNNQKAEKKSEVLSGIWNARFRLGKRWLFKKEKIDDILSD